MSKIEVNQISSQCGSTLTIGQSGDTVTLASGATAAGFGSTGEVSWDTTKKTTGFTAVSGVGYFCDTTSAAFTVTLPASPTAGNVVAVKDYALTFATNNLTIARNGSPINGANAADLTINTNGASLVLIYVDGTQGWVPTQDDSSVLKGESFIVATGGTITTCGNYKIHTFTGPGTFTVCSTASSSPNNLVDYLVVAGGGSGGRYTAGGGGAGGFRLSATTYTNSGPSSPRSACVAALPVTASAYPITVGAGGAALPATPTGPTGASNGNNGSNSVFSTITSTGGGGGGADNSSSYAGPSANPGGSGGGGGRSQTSGGTGNTPPVSPPQGSNGGTGGPDNSTGGGGAMAVGTALPSPAGSGTTGGAGGGIPNALGTSGQVCGSYYYFSGGGGGGSWNTTPQSTRAGGVGGGGFGGINNNAGGPSNGGAGTANTGGGGGGNGTTCGVSGDSGAGGSGIVIIRYKYQ